MINTGKPRGWMDNDGRLTKGKHKGLTIDTVAGDEPSYLRWMLSEVDGLTDDDIRVIKTALTYRR